MYAEHGLNAEFEDVDLILEREKYLQLTLATKQKQKQQRKDNPSEDDSSSSNSSAQNKPYQATATNRGLARIESKAQGMSSAMVALDGKIETLGETIAENNVNIKSETEKISSSMKTMGDKSFKDVTNLTRNTATITNAQLCWTVFLGIG